MKWGVVYEFNIQSFKIAFKISEIRTSVVVQQDKLPLVIPVLECQFKF